MSMVVRQQEDSLLAMSPSGLPCQDCRRACCCAHTAYPGCQPGHRQHRGRLWPAPPTGESRQNSAVSAEMTRPYRSGTASAALSCRLSSTPAPILINILVAHWESHEAAMQEVNNSR